MKNSVDQDQLASEGSPLICFYNKLNFIHVSGGRLCLLVLNNWTMTVCN